jgi:hypothetical protein
MSGACFPGGSDARTRYDEVMCLIRSGTKVGNEAPLRFRFPGPTINISLSPAL